MSFPKVRMRRLRKNSAVRRLLGGTSLSVSNFVYPIFVDENIINKQPIKSMPSQYRYSLKTLVHEVKEIVSLGIPAVILFGIPKVKNDTGSVAYARNGIIQKAVRLLKSNFGNTLAVITDVCLCEYTTHGHCGILKENDVANDETLNALVKIAVSHVEAGADIVAPSSMMDGQVSRIRDGLDKDGFSDVSILAYSAKFASSFYRPFREAVDSKPAFGDRKSYQMSYTNAQESLREVELDITEGADIVMVKPALVYLDVIKVVKGKFSIPLAAYNVSGEYSMIKNASRIGLIDEKEAVLEILTAIKRAGADIIVTYHAKDVAKWLNEGI
ncbi:MAG TPA: porphobilinogen synthase [Thermodesulfobacteriota bacterium]|nr:porphobilinogen synthase [Thermodesulfobacteriota bacterium]